MPAQTQQRYAYPPAQRYETLTHYYGTAVADPYCWLEDQGSPETQRWVAAQQKLAGTFLGARPVRTQIAERLAALWAFPKRSTPWRVGARTFFWGMDMAGGDIQSQPILYDQHSPGAAPFVVIDPQSLGDGTAAI